MQRVELAFFDDLDWESARESVPADETVYLSFGDTEVELDLSAEHAGELREFLAPYLRAGRVVRDTRVAPGKIVASRRAGEAKRAFADANAADHPTWTYRRRANGSYSYSRDLQEAYAEHAAAAPAATVASPVS